VTYPLATAAPVTPEIGVPGPPGASVLWLDGRDPTTRDGLDGDSAVDWSRGLVWRREAGAWSTPAAIGGAALAAMRAAASDALRARYEAQQALAQMQALAAQLDADLTAALAARLATILAALPTTQPESDNTLWLAGRQLALS
jgi:hypothetical protein